MNRDVDDAEEVLRLLNSVSITYRERKAVLQWAAKIAKKIVEENYNVKTNAD